MVTITTTTVLNHNHDVDIPAATPEEVAEGARNDTFVTPAGVSAAQIAFQQTVNDPSRPIVQVIREGRVNIRDLGVVGDGVADDTAAITAAYQRGLPLWEPNGNYRIANAGSDAGGVYAKLTKPLDVLRDDLATYVGDNLDNDIINIGVPAGGPGPSKITVQIVGGRVDQTSQKISTSIPREELMLNTNFGQSATTSGISLSTSWVDASLVVQNGSRLNRVAGVTFINAGHWQNGGGDQAIHLGAGADLSIAEDNDITGNPDLGIYCSGNSGRHIVYRNRLVNNFYAIAFKRSAEDWLAHDNEIIGSVAGIQTNLITGNGCLGGNAFANKFRRVTQLYRITYCTGANIDIGYAAQMGATLADGTTPVPGYSASAIILQNSTWCIVRNGRIADKDPNFGNFRIAECLSGDTRPSAYNRFENIIGLSGFGQPVVEAAGQADHNYYRHLYSVGSSAPHPSVQSNSRVERLVDGVGSTSYRNPLLFADGSVSAPSMARESSPAVGVYLGTNLVGAAVGSTTPGFTSDKTRFRTGFGRQKRRRTQSLAGFTLTISAGDHIVSIVKTGTAGAVTVHLPSDPVDGQEHVIKDASGTAAASNLVITPASGIIDGAASVAISTNFGRQAVVYNAEQDQWETI